MDRLKWRYFFDDNEVVQGPLTFKKEFSLKEFPVYIKEGAIVPMNVERAYTQLGDSTSSDFTTILIYPNKSNSFIHYKRDTREETNIFYEQNDDELKVVLEGEKIAHILRVHADLIPKKILLDDQELDASSWKYNLISKKIEIRTNADYKKGVYNIKFKN